jgi:hypothetical protein
MNGPRRSIWPDRPLTGMEAGMVLGVVALVVLCCLGVVVLGIFSPAPPAYQPLPTVSSS